MNIVIITGSRHRNGTTALLVDEFRKGAQDAGNDVFTFEAAWEEVGGCYGCDACGCGSAPCVQKDGMFKLYEPLKAADVVVFATPVYYYNMTGQIKTVIDRFYGINNLLQGSSKRACLISTCADTTTESLDNVVAAYESLCKYLGWTDAGQVLGTGLWKRADAQDSGFPLQAYGLGSSLD